MRMAMRARSALCEFVWTPSPNARPTQQCTAIGAQNACSMHRTFRRNYAGSGAPPADVAVGRLPFCAQRLTVAATHEFRMNRGASPCVRVMASREVGKAWSHGLATLNDVMRPCSLLGFAAQRWQAVARSGSHPRRAVLCASHPIRRLAVVAG